MTFLIETKEQDYHARVESFIFITEISISTTSKRKKKKGTINKFGNFAKPYSQWKHADIQTLNNKNNDACNNRSKKVAHARQKENKNGLEPAPMILSHQPGESGLAIDTALLFYK